MNILVFTSHLVKSAMIFFPWAIIVIHCYNVRTYMFFSLNIKTYLSTYGSLTDHCKPSCVNQI